MTGVTARQTRIADVGAVDALVKHVTKKDPKSTILLGRALLNLTALSEKDTVVGYLCLEDAPYVRLGQPSGAEEWVQQAAGARFTLGSSAFIKVCAIEHLYEIEAAAALLRTAFLLIPSLQNILVTASADLSFTEPGLASFFSRVGAHKDSGVVLYEAKRDAVVPPLAVRPARVEDHDDMLPILQRCEEAFPALAKLPESSRPQEPFALTRVVAGQDERNRVLVAEADNRLVGFIVMTSDVDTGSLSETFDLHPYDNFLPPELYEQQYQAAKASVREKKLAVLRAEVERRRAEEGLSAGVAATQTDPEEGEGDGQQQGEGEASPQGEGQEAGEPAEAEAAGGSEGGEAAAGSEPGEQEQQEGASGEDGGGGGEGGNEAASDEADGLAAAAEPTEEEIREEMAAMAAGQPPEAEPTLFAVTMLCMDPAYEAQAAEFMGPAFAAFPDKLYCVVTLPHDSREPAFMDCMTRVTPLPGGLFPEVLFMSHRSSLVADFTVRLGTPEDLPMVATLVSGMPNAEDICASFTGAAGAQTAAVALCQGEVVGLCTVNPEVDLELLQANFELSGHVDLGYHPRDLHGEIDMYTMNPIFVHRHRVFLASTMRLLGKSALYYALPPGQQPPDMQEVLEQVAPRHRGAQDKQLQAEFALYAFTRQAAFKRRRAVNSQIVIVGASECGLAVLERLLLDPELQFNYLTLLAPGGIKVGGMACQFTAGVIARLGLEARVLLLDAEVMGLDRNAKIIDLSDGSQLSYNQLVIAAGLQDQSRYRFAEADPEVAGLLVTELELAADFTMHDAMVMKSILIYGNALGAYHALSVLEAKAASEKTRFVAPPGRQPPVVALLQQMAEEAGVALPQPEPRELASLAMVQEGGSELHAVATLTDPTDPEVREGLKVDLVVGCETPSVSRSLFTCLNDASLVFDGRLVVDGSFRTNDPSIYAGGTLAKLSRRYGGEHLEHFNSRDVGSKLADSLISFFSSGAGEDQADGPSSSPAGQAPPPAALQRARAVGCSLPGGNHFMFAGCPTSLARPSLQPPEGGMEMSTKTDRGLMRVILDASGCVHSLMYMGRVPVSAQRLASLVGLHSNYLNQLATRFQAEQVHDLLTFLTEPWADLLYMESFLSLRETLLEMALSSLAAGGGAGEGGLKDVVAAAQDTVLEFARMHAAELPSYSMPDAART